MRGRRERGTCWEDRCRVGQAGVQILGLNPLQIKERQKLSKLVVSFFQSRMGDICLVTEAFKGLQTFLDLRLLKIEGGLERPPSCVGQSIGVLLV